MRLKKKRLLKQPFLQYVIVYSLFIINQFPGVFEFSRCANRLLIAQIMYNRSVFFKTL